MNNSRGYRLQGRCILALVMGSLLLPSLNAQQGPATSGAGGGGAVPQDRKCTLASEGPNKVIKGQSVTIRFKVLSGSGSWIAPTSENVSSGLLFGGSTVIGGGHPTLEVNVFGLLPSEVPFEDFVRAKFNCKGEEEPVVIEHKLTVLAKFNAAYACSVFSEGPKSINKNSKNKHDVKFTGLPVGEPLAAQFSAPTQQNLGDTAQLLDMEFAQADLADDNILTIKVSPTGAIIGSTKGGDARIETTYTTQVALDDGTTEECSVKGRHRITITDSSLGGIPNDFEKRCGGSATGPTLFESSQTAATTVIITFHASTDTPEAFLGWVTTTEGSIILLLPQFLGQPINVTVSSVAIPDSTSLTVNLSVAANQISADANDILVGAVYKCKLATGETIEVILTHEFTIISPQP